MDSKAPTVINPHWSNRAIPGKRYRQGDRDQWTGIVALALGIWAVIPVLLVMFI